MRVFISVIFFFDKVPTNLNQLILKRLFSLSFLILFSTVNSQVIDVSQLAHRLTVEVGEQNINGYLFLPPDLIDPIDVIIAAHGSGGLVSDCDDVDEIPEFKSQFRFWRDEVPKTGRAIFFIESFCERGVDSFAGKTPPEDQKLSPYQVRAEDVKQSARLLERLKFVKDGLEQTLIDDQVWIGWSHGAGAVVAAAYKVPANIDDLVFDVSSGGDEFIYGPPLSESFANVKGIMAWYGGYNFFGYFKDGSEIFYEPIDGITIITHCGSNDDICFKNSNEAFIQKMIDDGQNVTRYIYENVNHSFDNAKEDDSMEDEDARDVARERAFDFFDQIFKNEEPVLGLLHTTISIYPNPANEFLFLETSYLNPASFKIFDSTGKARKRGMILSSGRIDIRSFSDGVYFLSIDSDVQNVQKRFIIKRRP